jgi:hypothetical protein
MLSRAEVKRFMRAVHYDYKVTLAAYVRQVLDEESAGTSCDGEALRQARADLIQVHKLVEIAKIADYSEAPAPRADGDEDDF